MQPANTVWYLARAAGITSYLLLWVSLTLGIGITSRLFEPEIRRLSVFDLHAFISVFGVLFVGLHVSVLLLDQYVGFSLGELLVPFHSPYQPLWVGFGQVAFYLLLLTTFSFYVRKLIGQRWWRGLHYGTFALYAFALAHGILAGTDSGRLWMLMIYCTTGFMTLMMVATRLDALRRKPKVCHSELSEESAPWTTDASLRSA